MAFQLKYFADAKDDNARPYRVGIYENNFIGLATRKRLEGNGYDIDVEGSGRRDTYRTLRPAQAQAYFSDDGTIDDDVANAHSDDFLMRIWHTDPAGAATSPVYLIVNADEAGDYVEISGNHVSKFAAGAIVYAGDDAVTVVSATFEGGTTRTRITVQEQISSSVQGKFLSSPLQLIFEGLVVPSPDKRTLNFFDDAATVLARCTLADLKNEAFVDDNGDFFAGGSSVAGYMSTLEVIQKCLSKIRPLDLYTACNLFTPGMSSSVNPLAGYFHRVDALRGGDGYPFDCEQVLVDVLTPFQMEAFQSLGAWHVVRRADRFSGTYKRFRYSSAGAALGSENFNPVVAMAEADAKLLRLRTGRQPQMLAYKAVSVAFEHGEIPSLVRNGGFGIEVGRAERGPRGRTFGRGRGFIGRYNPDTTGEVQSANWVTSAAEQPITDVEPFGPSDGMNSVRIEALENSLGPAAINPALLATTVIQKTGRIVVGGGGRRLETHVSVFVDWNKSDHGDVADTSVVAPIYYRFVLQDVTNASNLRYLAPTGVFPTWSSALATIPFGAKFNRAGVVQSFGAPVESWQSETLRSAEIPTGTWRLLTYLFYPSQIHDFATYPLASDPPILRCYWSDIRADLVLQDGTHPTADVRTAYDPGSRQKLILSKSIFFGEAPVLDMPGVLTVANGTLATNFKEGPYAAEPPTGFTLPDMLARSLFLEQAENVSVHDAPYLKELPRIWPHQVFELAGVRYQVGDMNYNGGRARQGGQFVRIRRYGVTPTVDALAEEGTFTGIRDGGADSATRALIALQKDIFNRAAQNPIAVTTAVLGSGATSSNPVTVSQVPANILSAIEAGDGMLLITTDGRDFPLVASDNKTEEDAVLEFDPIELFAPVAIGSGIYPSTAEIKSLLIHTKNAFRVSLRRGLIAQLTADVELDGTEANPVLAVTPTENVLRHDDEIEVIDGVSAQRYTARVDASGWVELRVPELSESIPLKAGAIISAGIGSPVAVTQGQQWSDILASADEILLRVTNTRLIETLVQTGDPKRITTTTAPASSNTVSVEALLNPLPAGTKLRFLYKVILPEDKNEPVFKSEERTLQNAAGVGVESLVLTSAINMPFAGAMVYVTETSILTRHETTEGRVTITEQGVTAAAARYEKTKIAELAQAYNGSVSVLSLKNRTRDIKIGDQFLATRMSDGEQSVAIAASDLSAGAAAANLTIQTTNVVANANDPFLPGTLSSLRIEFNGINVEAPKMQATSWNGTVDASGNITAFGTSSGWVLTKQGHFEFRASAGRHFRWNGGDFEFAGRVVITAGTGIGNLDDAGALALKDQASWNGDINDIPGRFATDAGNPPVAGLYLTNQFMGYWSGAAWNAYIDQVGNFAFTGDLNNSITWNGTTLTIKGALSGVTGTFAGSLSAATGTFAGSLTAATGTFLGYVDAGGGMKMGRDVDGTNDGIFINTNNYWYSTGLWRIGGATQFLRWDGATMTVRGDLTASNISSGVLTGIEINNGSGTFFVTALGALTATSATITGAITATSGSLGDLSVTGTLTMSTGFIRNAASDFVISSGGIQLASSTSFSAAKSLTWSGNSARIWYLSSPSTLIVANTAGDLELQVAGEVTKGGSDILWSHANSGDRINALTALASPNGATSYVVVYDGSSIAGKKVLLNNLPSGGGGDITAVTAGDGLSGGGTTGAVSLALSIDGLTTTTSNGDLAYFAISTPGGNNRKIAPGSINISGFNNDAGYGAGDITGVSAGNGLSGGGTSGSVTLNLNIGGLTGSTVSTFLNGSIPFDNGGNLKLTVSSLPYARKDVSTQFDGILYTFNGACDFNDAVDFAGATIAGGLLIGSGTPGSTSSRLYNSGGTLHWSGDVVDTSPPSDERFKTAITGITDPFSRLEHVGGYSFMYNELVGRRAGEWRYGVLAQELQAVLPHAVKRMPSGYLYVEYDQLIPVLIEAVKNLNRRVEELGA